ncbi:MAG: putative toxin-antitoxin system toxin component, PIN family [Terracidiphilus sp.]|nr:putative toxin-antitoxin system toxin component, PIN family [Terracidiphilus sp.]
MEDPRLRVVFDTSSVLSALLFAHGGLAWLRQHWRVGASTPLISKATASELMQVLAYPKFRLTLENQLELAGDYLPFCQSVRVVGHCSVLCRDRNDQPLLDLAESGGADVLVSSDGDLLVLKGQTRFAIESPEEFRRRFKVQ